MKIVTIGGTGLIGKKLCTVLRQQGHEVLAASPSTGVDTLTGDGLSGALQGAQVVVDTSDSPSFETTAVLNFFETSARNIAIAETAAGVQYHIVLSVVGADRMTGGGYMRAKVAQESIIRKSGVPFTILRATQFYEFLSRIADASQQDGVIRLPEAQIQPLAAEDVVTVLAEIVTSEPIGGILEVAGPEKRPMAEMVQTVFTARHDQRKVVVDPRATYFGAPIGDSTLTPTDGDAHIASTRLEDWLRDQA